MTAPSTAPSRAPTILVTGASGFIGSVLTQSLTAGGYQTLAGVRSAAPRHGRPVPCNLDRPDEVAAAMQGVDLVVHAAYGAAPGMASQCRTLLAAMTHAGAGRLVYLSSIAVYGDATGDVTEADVGKARTDAYGAAKLDCEAAIADWASGPGRAAIVLRPGIVYGAGSPFWIEKLTDRIASGVWGRFGDDGEGVAALIHVDDLVAEILAATRILTDQARPAKGVQALNAIGPDTPSWNAYFTALAAALGVTLRDMPAGERKRRQLLAAAAKLWRSFNLPGGRAAALFPMPGEMALFARKARYDAARARETLGLSPAIGLEEGLKRSLPHATGRDLSSQAKA